MDLYRFWNKCPLLLCLRLNPWAYPVNKRRMNSVRPEGPLKRSRWTWFLNNARPRTRVPLSLIRFPNRVTNSFRSRLSRKIDFPSIPRIITWCRVPGESNLAWRGTPLSIKTRLKGKVHIFHYVPFNAVWRPFIGNSWRKFKGVSSKRTAWTLTVLLLNYLA